MEMNESELRLCNDTLALLIKKFDMVAAVIVSSQDGLHVASKSQDAGMEMDAIAAMSASLLSLADALAGQAGKPMVDNVISEAESSTLVILHAGELILTVIGQTGINIGLILSSARTAAKEIGTMTETVTEDVKSIEVRGLTMLQNPELLLERIKKEMKEKNSGNNK
ncbi:MAG: roadblock/LC7 domain-containing protein [Mariprofundaceae bacterium]